MIIIVQIGSTTQLMQAFNIEPFVYGAYPGAFSTSATFQTALGFSFPTVITTIQIIDFVRNPNIRYTRQTSYANVVATEGSWYFDFGNQALYFHTEHAFNPLTASYSQGVAYGFSDTRPVSISGIPYLPLVESVPSISQQQDLVNYDKLSLITGSVTMRNAINSDGSGMLDFLIAENVYGNRLNILSIDDTEDVVEYENADLVSRGSFSIDDYDISTSKVDIRIKDLRESGRVSAPREVFTVADYPNIDDDLVNTVIPILWGDVREIPLICVDGKLTSGNVTYRAALSLTTAGAVYVKDGDNWTLVTPDSVTLSNGTIVLLEADARNNNKPREAKLVNCSGIPNSYASDVIIDINERFLGLSESSSNYDLDEWNAEKVYLSPIGLYINSPTNVLDIITKIQNGANVGFRYEINPEGKRTIRIDREDRDTVLHVPNVDIVDRNVLSVSTDSETLAAIVRVKHSLSYVSDKYIHLVDDSLSDTVNQTYRQNPVFETETLLTNATDAQERADYILDRFATIRGIYTGTVFGSQYLDLRIYDLITIEITPSEFVDIDSNSIAGRAYYGLKTLKILSVDPDISNKQNTITGVIISDAVFPEVFQLDSDGETQAWLLDDGQILLAN